MFLTDAQIKTSLAGFYRTAEANLPAQLTDVIADAHTAAYQDILSGLLDRSITLAQIVQWDRGAEFERMLSLYWILVNSGENVNYGPLISNYDRRKDLKTVLVSINGVFVVPNATDAPGDIGIGNLDTSNDLFVMDPDDDRIGQPSRF